MMRQSNGEQLANKVQPDSTKSTSAQLKQEVEGAADTAASYLPGQHKTADHLVDNKRDTPWTHDTGRAGPLDSIADAIKPKSSETIGDKLGRHGDNAASALQPEHNKGIGQKVMDTVNPEKYGTAPAHHNSTTNHATTGEKPGVVASVTNAVKDTVNTLTGSGNHANHNLHNI